MSKDQREEIVRYIHPLDENLKVVSARIKHNRNYRAIVAQDGDQILHEWWPPTQQARKEAEIWLDGYRFAKNVWSP